MAETVDPETDGWGTTTRGRTRRRWRPLRVIAILVIVVLVAVLALALFASSRIPRQPVDGLAGSGSPMHVLVTGSDSREGLSPEQQNELTIGRDAGSERTDTIFLMSIDGSRVGLLAFPRDLWVRRCDGSTGRINVAVQIGGPSCLVQTVRELSGIDVQHHVQVTFGGFRDVVDAVEGVEICLDEAIADRDAGIDLPSGCQRLDGVDALGYVRVRKIDNDLQRIQRQQQFVRALAGEIVQPATLFDPVRMLRLSNDVGGAVTVDDGMGIVGLLRLAWGARGLAGGTSVTETVPSTVGTAGDAQVLFVDDAAAGPVFRAFADGSALHGADAVASLDPAEIPVRVLNGAGAPGLAGEVAKALDARGYPVVEVGNIERRDLTVVQHPRPQAQGARTVAGDLPGDVDVEAADVPQVTVVLGSDVARR